MRAVWPQLEEAQNPSPKRAVQSLPASETAPCGPQNIYAADRLASENYCSIHHLVYDTDTVVMRLTNTFGAREQHDNH